MTEIVGALAADVDPAVRALTDASTPLPPGTVFWQTLDLRQADSSWMGYLAASAVMMLGLYAVVTYRWATALYAGTFVGDPVESFLSLQLLMAFPTLWLAYPAWHRARVGRRQPPGERRGVFLSADHVVVYDGGRYAVLGRAPGRFAVRPRWRPLRRSWDLRVAPGFTEPFSVEVDGRVVDPVVSGPVIAGYGG